MTHHYFVTEPVPEFADLVRELPVIRDDRMVSGYIRMEQLRGLIGIYEKKIRMWCGRMPVRGRRKTNFLNPIMTA